jgi:hypothetical protein
MGYVTSLATTIGITRSKVEALDQGEEPEASGDGPGDVVLMITESRNSGFAAQGAAQMGSDTCSASRTTDTYFQSNAWQHRSRTGEEPFVPQLPGAQVVAHPGNSIEQRRNCRQTLL